MRRRACWVLAVTCLGAGVVGLLPATAGAALPGRNGSIAFGTADVVYLGSDEEAYVIATLQTGLVGANGRRRRILGGGGDPAFSPGGRLLALARGGIVLRPVAGKKLTRLTRGPDRMPTWSPSGRRLAFAREVPGPPPNYCEWTGSREVSYDSSDSCPARLYTIGRDGRGLRVLAERGWNPSWSSRGEIAYEGADGGVWAIESRGIAARRVVENGVDPEWSPRGDRLAFVGRRGTRQGLFVVDRDGTDVRRLYVTGRNSLHSLAWSPDGRRIAFVKDGAPQGNGLFKLALASGARPQRVMGIWCPACSEAETLYGLTWQPLPAPG